MDTFQISSNLNKWNIVKGGLTENYVYTYDRNKVEVDFILEGKHVDNVVIEVKSSENKRSLSLKKFLDQKKTHGNSSH